MKFNRLAGALLALSLVMTACGGSDSAASEPEPTAAPAPTEAPAPPPTPEPEPTATPEPEPTATPEPEPTATPEPEPTATPEPEPTAVPAEDAGDDADADSGAETAEDGGGEDDAEAGEGEADVGQGDDPQAEAATTASADGPAIFATNCAGCHGADGGGTDRGANIATIGQFFTTDPSPLVGLVTNGGTFMPEFGSKLSADEITAVVTYVVDTFQ